MIDDFPRFVNSNGFVSSKWSDGSDEHEGEGILWSGVAMAFLPCHMGKGISKKMADLIVKNDGKVVRWLDDQGSLGEYADGREITMDGTTGLYAGIAKRVVECGERSVWLKAMMAHKKWLDDNDGILYPDTVKHPWPFNFVRDGIFWRLGLVNKPSGAKLRFMGVSATGWVTAVLASESAAFRVHLAWLHMWTADKLGFEVSRDGFCYPAKKVGIPIVSSWCGSPGLNDEFMRSFEKNKWEYRHQRGKWETPDGRNGLDTPGLDFIVSYHSKYGG